MRPWEHIGLSALLERRSNHLPSFDNFSVLAHENRNNLSEIKGSLLIMRDKPSLNRNINSTPLYLFDKVS